MSDVTKLNPADDSPQGQIDELEMENAARLAMLDARGSGVPLALLLAIKIDTLIEFSVPVATRQMFDFVLERNVAAFIEQWEKQHSGLVVASTLPPEGAS